MGSTRIGVTVVKKVRTFDSGATRDTDDGKLDYEGFFHPLVTKRFAEYMHKHRKQADGEMRTSDNWQKGMPRDEYMKSAWRHFHDWWTAHRKGDEDEEAMCALLFNVMGYLHEVRLCRDVGKQDDTGSYFHAEPGSCRWVDRIV